MPNQDDHWQPEVPNEPITFEAFNAALLKAHAAGVRRGREEMREEAVKYCEKAVARWLHKAGLSPEMSAAHLASECAYEDAADAIRNIPLDSGGGE